MNSIAFADTHVGQRPNNEDWYGIIPEIGLFAVADGMGGYHGGEIASRVAVGTLDGFYRHIAHDDELFTTSDQTSKIDKLFLNQSQMDMAFRVANNEVRKHRKGKLSKMGSTLSALIIRGNKALIGHIGDSRVYRYRHGTLEQLTSDHSLVATLQSAGISNLILKHKFGHVITKAIGVSESSAPDIFCEKVEPGDLYLLCTDGLTDVVGDGIISELLGELSPADACTALVEESLRRGGEDNITSVVVEIRGDTRLQRMSA